MVPEINMAHFSPNMAVGKTTEDFTRSTTASPQERSPSKRAVPSVIGLLCRSRSCTVYARLLERMPEPQLGLALCRGKISSLDLFSFRKVSACAWACNCSTRPFQGTLLSSHPWRHRLHRLRQQHDRTVPLRPLCLAVAGWCSSHWCWWLGARLQHICFCSLRSSSQNYQSWSHLEPWRYVLIQIASLTMEELHVIIGSLYYSALHNSFSTFLL